MNDPAAVAATAGPAAAGAFRRLAAAVYDSLLLLALLFLVTALLQAFTGGEAITYDSVGAWEYAYRATVLAVIAAYFGYAWTRSGETLGMKAWKIRVVRESGERLAWGDTLRRLGVAAPLYAFAVAGLLLFMTRRIAWPGLVLACVPLLVSYAWLRLPGGATLHDRWSRTRVLRLPPS